MKIPGTKKVARLVVGLHNTNGYRTGWDAVFKPKPWYRRLAQWVTQVVLGGDK